MLRTTGVEILLKIDACRNDASVQFSNSVMPDSLWPHKPQHARPLCSSPAPGVHLNPCSLHQWCHQTISSSVVPFSSCPQSFPASRSLQMTQLFAWGGQSIGVSASASVLPMGIQGWFPLGLTSLISLLSKGLPRVFSNTTVQNHQFFGNSFLESINSLALRLLNSPTLTSVRDYWKT